MLGSAGSNRIRSAILQTIVGVVDRGLDARGRRRAPPRLHFEDGVVYAEPGDRRRRRCARTGPRRSCASARRNLFFGGVQAVAARPGHRRASGAGDPRRGGAAVAA